MIWLVLLVVYLWLLQAGASTWLLLQCGTPYGAKTLFLRNLAAPVLLPVSLLHVALNKLFA